MANGDRIKLDETDPVLGDTPRNWIIALFKQKGLNRRSFFNLKEFKDRSDAPTGLTASAIGHWLTADGNVKTARRDLWAFVTSIVSQLPDASPGRERVALDGKIPEDKLPEDAAEKDISWRAELRRLYRIKNVKAGSFFEKNLQGRDDVPAGLTKKIVQDWTAAKSRLTHADLEFIQYVIKHLRELPDAEFPADRIHLESPVQPGIPFTVRDALRRFLTRKGIKGEAFYVLFKDHPERPASLKRGTIDSWIRTGSKSKTADATAYYFVARQLRNLPNPPVELDAVFRGVSHRDRVQAMLDGYGIKRRPFFRYMDQDPNKPAKLTRIRFERWFDPTRPVAEVDREELAFVYRKLRDLMDWDPGRHITVSPARRLPEEIWADDLIQSARRFVRNNKRRLDETNPDDRVLGVHCSVISEVFRRGNVIGWEKYMLPSSSAKPTSVNQFLAIAGVYSKSGTRRPQPKNTL